MPGQMPPQGEPPQGGEGQAGGDGGGDVGQAIAQIDKSLQALAQAAPPEFADKLSQISDAFRSVVEEMMQASDGGGPQKGPSGPPGAPEAGGNPNAKPAGF